MKTEEEKEERIKKAGMEMIDLLVDRNLTTGEGIIALTRCLAGLIASVPDKGKRNKTLACVIMSLTESVATLEKAFEAGAVRVPEEGGGE